MESKEFWMGKNYDIEVINDPYYLSISHNYKLSDLVTKHFDFYQNLTHIKCRGISRMELSVLPKLKNLKIIFITDLIRDNFEYIFECNSLETVNLHPAFTYDYNSYENFSCKFKSNHIRHLSLSSFIVETQNIIKFSNLEYLQLLWCKFNNLNVVEKLPHLRKLFINTIPFSSLDFLFNNNTIEQLGIYHSKNIENFEPLFTMKSLKLLDLKGTPISNNLKNRLYEHNIKVENLEIKKWKIW